MHPLRVTVWCALWSGVTLGPDFFANEDGASVTINTVTHRTMITDFRYPLFTVLMWTMFGFNKMVELSTHLMSQSIFLVKRLITIQLAGMVMSFGSQEAAIWNSWIIFCGAPLKNSVMPTYHRRFSIRRLTFVRTLPRYDDIHSKKCMKIDSFK